MTREITDAYIDAAQKDILADLFKLISYPSTHENKDETRACLEWFLQRARQLGFNTRVSSDWQVGVVEMGQGEETLGILVHLDVVGIGDLDKWTHDPFHCVLQDGFLWGRGTADDKGGAVISLYAMKAVQMLNLPLQKKVWLIVGTSEEAEWTDIASFKREFPLPCCGFSPDGMFPIFNIEKGYADLVLKFQLDAHHTILNLQAGDSPNTIPSRAEIQFTGGDPLVIQGVSVHSSVPHEGDNAILKLCSELGAVGRDDLNFVRFVNRYLGNSGHARELYIDDSRDILHGEFIGLTTAAPTVLRMDGDQVYLTINIRYKYGTRSEDILRAFSSRAQEYGFEISCKGFLEPMMVSRELPFLKIMAQVSDEYGVDSGFRTAPGTSYAKSMPNFVSWGPVFPGDPQTAHMEDERLSLNSLLLAGKLYAHFLNKTSVEGDERLVGGMPIPSEPR